MENKGNAELAIQPEEKAEFEQGKLRTYPAITARVFPLPIGNSLKVVTAGLSLVQAVESREVDEKEMKRARTSLKAQQQGLAVEAQERKRGVKGRSYRKIIEDVNRLDQAIQGLDNNPIQKQVFTEAKLQAMRESPAHFEFQDNNGKTNDTELEALSADFQNLQIDLKRGLTLTTFAQGEFVIYVERDQVKPIDLAMAVVMLANQTRRKPLPPQQISKAAGILLDDLPSEIITTTKTGLLRKKKRITSTPIFTSILKSILGKAKEYLHGVETGNFI